MLKSVTVTNHLDESIDLELMNPEKSGFYILGITGLGPSKANIHMSEMSTSDGALYNSARTTPRNIVLTLGFLFSPTIEDVRHLSYKYFPIKKRIRLRFDSDNRSSYTYGYVESNEPNIFSSSETTQISILCPDPYFYSVDETLSVFSGLESMFTFPFSNESLTENLIELGNIKHETTQEIFYEGDADVGVVITIHALDSVEDVAIYNTDTRESMSISSERLIALTGQGIVAGDDIIISTVKGAKYATLLRNGIFTNILNCLNREADWFQLSKGPNTFAYTASTGVNALEFMIESRTLYEGV